MASRLESGRVLLDETEVRRFYSYCVVDLVTGCWNWTGATDEKGYGRFNVEVDGIWEGRQAYWWAYNHFVGEVPKYEELGHTPSSDKCTFYEHVRPITHKENAQERLGTIDRCPQGHLRSLFSVDKKGGGSYCSACKRISNARSRGQTVCTCCGYSPCRFSIIQA